MLVGFVYSGNNFDILKEEVLNWYKQDNRVEFIKNQDNTVTIFTPVLEDGVLRLKTTIKAGDALIRVFYPYPILEVI